MTTYQFFTTAWTWNSILLLLSALALAATFSPSGNEAGPSISLLRSFYFFWPSSHRLARWANGYLFSATWFSISCSC